MQLWKKNFLITYLMFLLVIYGSLFFLESYIFGNEAAQWTRRAVTGEKALLYMVSGLENESGHQALSSIDRIARRYEEEGILLTISLNGNTMVSYVPEGIEAADGAQMTVYKGEQYLVLSEEQVKDERVVRVVYMESLAPLYHGQRGRMLILYLAGAGVSLLVGGMLYYTMKRINRPVSRIAHEMRTPLTGIRGYAEYIQMAHITEEDRFYAAGEIVESAANLEDVIEKLLIMGNIREGSIHYKTISIRELLEGIRKQMETEYPDTPVTIICHLDVLKGDRTLVQCILTNLISNACKAGNHVEIRAEEGRIRIWNDGNPMDEKTLRAVNKRQKRAKAQAGKHGYGILLSKEIAKEHNWRLKFESSEESGTVAEILL